MGSSFDYKLCVVIRKDLKLSPGKTAVQVAHAAVSCSLGAKKKNTLWFNAWFKEGQKKVVLKGKDLSELFFLKEKAESLGIQTSLISDAGLTEIPPGTVTCLGIGPAPADKVDSVTGQLPLL